MTSTPAPTWWEEFHAAHSGDDAPADSGFSGPLLALLSEVEQAYARIDPSAPAWDDPHLMPDGETRARREEEYSRCLDPGKLRILGLRAEAWTRVLTARGWADAEVSEGGGEVTWSTPVPEAPQITTVLRPHRPGAAPLVLAWTPPDESAGALDFRDENALAPGLTIGVGDPAVVAEIIPDCVCDACDSGSRELLEQLGTAILSVVDGSFEVELTANGYSQRTSFSCSGGSGTPDREVPRTVTAEPWAEGWPSRPLVPRLDPLESRWAEETAQQFWGRPQFDPLPPPLTAWLRRWVPGESGPRRYWAWAPHPDQQVTIPPDALEIPPPGYRRLHRSAVVTGMDFETAASALRHWVLHRRAGLVVMATHTPAEEGTEVWLRLGAGPLRITAPCRVLEVIDEPERSGFVYATLPGHPESGIEQFTVTRTATGLVRLHLDAVSRPATWYARLGAPLARLVQGRITQGYLRALSSPPGLRGS